MATLSRLALGVGLSCALAACKSIPADRYGIERIRFEGVDAMDARALAACLATQEREVADITLGVGGTPTCGQPPFDRDAPRARLFYWPWTTWPLYDESLWEKDLDRILRWYQARGFPNARVLETRIEPESAAESDVVEEQTRCRRRRGGGCRARITVVIEEGEPVRVRSLDIDIPEELDEPLQRRLREAVFLREGARFDEQAFDAAKDAMTATLAEEGHCRARAEGAVRISRTELWADIEYTVAPGPRCTIGEVTVTGAESLSSETIRRAGALVPDRTFRPSDLHEAQQAIFALGAFGSVEVLGRVPEEGSVVPVEIRVTPARRNSYQIGGGVQSGLTPTVVDTETQVASQWDIHVLGRWENRNFLGGMRRIALEDRVRLIWNREFPRVDAFQARQNLGNMVTLEFEQPAFLESRTSLSITALYDFGPDPFERFVRHSIRAGVDVSRWFFRRRLRVSLGLHTAAYQVPRQTTFIPSDAQQDWLSTYWQELIEVDLRDAPVRTTRGVYLQLRMQQAGFGLPSDWDYFRLLPEARAYVPLFAGIVLATRFRLGMLFVDDHFGPGLAPDNPLRLGPTIHRFRGGGPVGNRGFLAQRLGDGEAGGARSWEASLEVRTPVTNDFWLVLFGDAGDVHRQESFRWDHLQLSLGFGLRYYTIVGPIRLDVGFRVPGAQVLGGADQRVLSFCEDESTGDTVECVGPAYRGRVFGGPGGAIHLTIGESF